MEKLSAEKLQEIIESHGKWWRDEEGGSRANLSRADLSRADLSDADLRGANLSRADLSRADLPKQIIQVGPIGSRKSQTVYNVTDDVVQCGCWNNYKGGSLEDFEARVRSEYTDNNKHFIEYMNAIAYFKLLRGV